MTRQAWVGHGNEVSMVWQCALAGVSRATVYARQRPRPVDESDLLLCRLRLLQQPDEAANVLESRLLWAVQLRQYAPFVAAVR